MSVRAANRGRSAYGLQIAYAVRLGLPCVLLLPDMTTAQDAPSVEPVARRGGNVASKVVMLFAVPEALDVKDEGYEFNI
jgi:hypothetical protein